MTEILTINVVVDACTSLMALTFWREDGHYVAIIVVGKENSD